ncbi:MAG: hypothetical protein AB7E52_00300 [Bdellovibrionales bacterium]
MVDFYDLIGLAGVCLSMGNYARLQWQRDYAKRMAFSLGNFMGSCFIILSLLHKWNLSAFVVNALVASISAYGVYRCLKYKIRERQTATLPLRQTSNPSQNQQD